jgi:hypothetical protein
MCEIIRESMRGGKKLHLDWIHIFGVRLGQDVGLYASNLNSIYKGWHEGIFLRDLTNWLATNVCINLENLQQKVEKKQQSVEKEHPNRKFLLTIIKHIDIFKSFAYNAHYFRKVIIIILQRCTLSFWKNIPYCLLTRKLNCNSEM